MYNRLITSVHKDIPSRIENRVWGGNSGAGEDNSLRGNKAADDTYGNACDDTCDGVCDDDGVDVFCSAGRADHSDHNLYRDADDQQVPKNPHRFR